MGSKEDKQTILVVDDAPVNINLLSNILSPHYKVKGAINGEKALKIAHKTPQPDLILLDIVMPGMSGYTVCEQLKQDPLTASIPVIFITAKTTTEDEQHGLELGAVDYITKPISPAIVEARVKTQLSLRKNMEDLRRAYAIIETQKNRMQQELNVGRDIQLAMVPKEFPVSPHFSLFAALEPAREVGGDFYDAFVIDKNRLCFCVGDVSGKGVPAALFMAMAKTLIKARASSDPSPASIVTHVNDELSRDNEGCLFVTLFVCILDIRSGELLTTNAGHNPPLLKQGDGNITALAERDGLVVAAMEGIAYTEQSRKLQKDDTLLLYTDGVTEAENSAEEFFGDKRLKKLFGESQDTSVEQLVGHIIATTHAFEGANRQADDITVLSLHYFGEKADETPTITITISNELINIKQVITQFMEFSSDNEISSKISNPVCMAFDELLANIVSYAYADTAYHEITVKISLTHNDVVMVITDDGLPFNPFTREAPDTRLSIEEREVGGLGIHLVKNVMDEVYYKRHIDRNVITLVKHIE